MLQTVPRSSAHTRASALALPAGKSALALSVLLALVACGSGGDDAASPAMNTVEGSVVKGPVKGATVVAYRVAADGTLGAELGRVTSGSDGSYQLKVPTDATTVVLQASGGTYDDEAVEGVDSTTLTAPLRGWVALPTAGRTATAHLTPLTETAVRRALFANGGATLPNLTAAAAAVAGEAGLTGTDLAGTAPVVTSTPNAYGQALVRFARLALLAGGVDKLLATYAVAVPGEMDAVAATEVPAEYRNAALLSADWYQPCVSSAGTVTVAAWGISFKYQSYREGVQLFATSATTPLDYVFDDSKAYFDDADCQRVVLLDGVPSRTVLTLESLVTLADGSKALRGTAKRTVDATRAVTYSKVALRVNGTDATRTLDTATGPADASGYPSLSAYKRHTVGYQPSSTEGPR